MNNGYKDPTALQAINNLTKQDQAKAKAKRGINLGAHQTKKPRKQRIRAVTYK